MRNRWCGWSAKVVFGVLLISAAAAQAQLAATGTLASGNQEEWKPYSYPTDGFQAAYPSEPALQKKSVETTAGSFELRSYAVQPIDAVLFVGVCDYGASASGISTAARLEGAKNGALLNSGSRLVSQKKIALGNYPGIEFDGESMTAHFTARIYAVDTRLYQVLVIYPLAKPYAQAARFLDSFQLVALSPDAAGKPAATAGK